MQQKKIWTRYTKTQPIKPSTRDSPVHTRPCDRDKRKDFCEWKSRRSRFRCIWPSGIKEPIGNNIRQANIKAFQVVEMYFHRSRGSGVQILPAAVVSVEYRTSMRGNDVLSKVRRIIPKKSRPIPL
jgi:hypothetical protein